MASAILKHNDSETIVSRPSALFAKMSGQDVGFSTPTFAGEKTTPTLHNTCMKSVSNAGNVFPVDSRHTKSESKRYFENTAFERSADQKLEDFRRRKNQVEKISNNKLSLNSSSKRFQSSSAAEESQENTIVPVVKVEASERVEIKPRVRKLSTVSSGSAETNESRSDNNEDFDVLHYYEELNDVPFSKHFVANIIKLPSVSQKLYEARFIEFLEPNYLLCTKLDRRQMHLDIKRRAAMIPLDPLKQVQLGQNVFLDKYPSEESLRYKRAVIVDIEKNAVVKVMFVDFDENGTVFCNVPSSILRELPEEFSFEKMPPSVFLAKLRGLGEIKKGMINFANSKLEEARSKYGSVWLASATASEDTEEHAFDMLSTDGNNYLLSNVLICDPSTCDHHNNEHLSVQPSHKFWKLSSRNLPKAPDFQALTTNQLSKASAREVQKLTELLRIAASGSDGSMAKILLEAFMKTVVLNDDELGTLESALFSRE